MLTVLTEKEMQVAQAIAEGLTNKEIASHMKTSEQCVKNRVRFIYVKLGFGGAGSRQKLAAWFSRKEQEA